MTEPRSRMAPQDYELSMRISRRPRREEPDRGLRSLIVHRLIAGPKAVFRVALRTGRFSVHCEPCGQWFPVDDPLEEWQCDRCGREYEAELIVYSEIPAESGS